MATLTLEPYARHELKIFGALAAVFAAIYFLPVGQPRFDAAVTEALELTKWYAREHVVLCLLPAFWIAGAIAAFVSKASVMRYLGPTAPKPLAYGVGSVSGTILAVCSCTVLPIFSGIYRMGAGPGSGNRIPLFGPGDQRARHRHDGKGARRSARPRSGGRCGGVQRDHRNADGDDLPSRGAAKVAAAATLPEPEAGRPLWQTATFFAVLVGILIFANWGAASQTTGFFAAVYSVKWLADFGARRRARASLLWRWFKLEPVRIATVAAATAVAACTFRATRPGRSCWRCWDWRGSRRVARTRRASGSTRHGLHEADRASPARRRTGGWLPAGSPRSRRDDSF